MNNTMPLSVTTPPLHQQTVSYPAVAPSFFARLQKALTAFFAPGDDPAALRYIASKYNGEGD